MCQSCNLDYSSHLHSLFLQWQWEKSNTNLFALRGSEVTSSHRMLQNFGNRSFVMGDSGNRSEGFPAFGSAVMGNLGDRSEGFPAFGSVVVGNLGDRSEGFPAFGSVVVGNLSDRSEGFPAFGSVVMRNFGDRSEGFPAFGIEGGTFSSSNASTTGGGIGGGGGVGYNTVNNKTVSTISGNVTSSPDGDVFYFPGTNFSIGDGFALQLRTNFRQRRWRKQRRRQWQRQQRQNRWQRPQQ
jgi:hypothetical protein